MDHAERPGLEIRLLGPVSVAVGGRDVAIGSPKQRIVLAMLALSRRVTVDGLADELWRESPPASVAATVQTLVSRLRKILDDAGADLVIRYEPGAYALEVDPSCVDVHRFYRLVGDGRRALDGGCPGEAAGLLRRALDLWRGSALEDLADRGFAQLTASRLAEVRVAAGEDLAAAELAGGRPAAALDVVESLIVAHPFRERLRAEQMTALYRLGRQADALAAYQALRIELAQELGLAPSPALQELERHILLQDPALDHRPAVPANAARPEPPAEGTLAFLFTDIEASTGRWEGDRTAMSADLARHDAILSEAIVAHSGQLFTHTGDGLGAAFPTAASALAAAIDGQLALRDVQWQGSAPMRVRMAIHIGAAEARAGTFLGPTLNRTARLLDEAIGGEILCSQAAADLARDELAEGVSLVELGECRLEGLSRTERVWQALHPGLPTDRRSPPGPIRNPTPLTSFIGRETELAELCDLLPRTRLLTIAGVGGTGKTRLALELAARMSKHFGDGHAVIELAPVTETRLLPVEILAALGVDAGGPAAAEEQLLHVLARREILLVLDNCEHILEPVAALVHLVLAHCETVTLLATSREVLGVSGETVWTAPGLSLPPYGPLASTDLSGSDAAALFVARAGAARPGFGVTDGNVDPIARICRRLDGLPLALELAAARVRVLGVTEIAERLDDRFRLLTGGPRSSPSRHQTLRAAMEWSFELLAPQERRLLARLAVFPQSFDLSAATAVAPEDSDSLGVLDLLARLIDKSLVLPEGAAGTARYRLLETVRQYAGEVLAEAGEEKDAGLRHRGHYVGWIQETFRSGGNLLTDWIQAVEVDRENCHAALVGALADGDMDSASVLIAGLYGAWFWHTSVPEVLDAVDTEALRAPDASFLIEAHLGVIMGGLVTGRVGWDEALRIMQRARVIADQRGTAWDRGWVRYLIGYAARAQGDSAAARQWMEEARQEFSDPIHDVWPNYELGWIDMTEDAPAAAEEHFRHGLALIDGQPGYETMDVHVRGSLALAEAAIDRTADGLAHAREAVDLARWLDLPGVLVMAQIRSAQTAAVAGAAAEADLVEALRILRDHSSRRFVADALTLAALQHESRGSAVVAARLLGGAAAVAESLGEDPQPIPVIARLVTATEARLASELGADLAGYKAAGAATSVPGLLQMALGGRCDPTAPPRSIKRERG